MTHYDFAQQINNCEYGSELTREQEQQAKDNEEKQAALRKLLEAKDAAVRSRIFTNNYVAPDGTVTMSNSPDGSHRI